MSDERRDELVRRSRRTARQLRWAVRGVLALAAALAIVWLLLLKR